MVRSLMFLVPLLVCGCTSSRSTALRHPAVIQTYATRLFAFFALLRSDFHAPRMPVVMVGLQRYCSEEFERGSAARCDELSEWQTIRAAQHAVAANLPRVAIVDVSHFTWANFHPIAQYPVIGRLLAEQAGRFE